MNKVVIAVVRNQEGKVLIVLRNKEEIGKDGVIIRWVFPGGKIEAGESLEQAAQRETLEESGYRVRAGKLITESPHPQFPVYIYYYDCRLITEDRTNSLAADIQEYRWVEPGELDNYFTTHLDETVRDYLMHSTREEE